MSGAAAFASACDGLGLTDGFRLAVDLAPIPSTRAQATWPVEALGTD
jgi:hypothetical protein